MNGSLYTWSSINSYFASYLHHHGQDITVEDLYFLMPCIFLVQYCFMTIGVKIGDSYGPRVTTIIGVFFMVGSYAFLSFFTNYYLILLGMGLFGFGDGTANLSVINNGWNYFKKNKLFLIFLKNTVWAGVTEAAACGQRLRREDVLQES